MNFDDVRKQLQAKNLNLGLWLQAVIDGEVAPFKLRPTGFTHDIENIRLWLQAVIDGEVASFKPRPARFTHDIENIRLAHFAFHRDQIRHYLSRNCPELDLPVSEEVNHV